MGREPDDQSAGSAVSSHVDDLLLSDTTDKPGYSFEIVASASDSLARLAKLTTPHGVVDTFHHRRVPRLDGLLAVNRVFRSHLFNGLDRRMHRVGAVRQKEGAIGVRENKLAGFRPLAMGEELPGAARFQLIVKVVTGVLVRIEVRRGLADIATFIE